MRALKIACGQKNGAELADVPEPSPDEGSVLIQTLSLGVCGTDREIVAGALGQPPADCDTLVLGHESLGRVGVAPPGSGFSPGDHVVGIVRRPDPVP